MSSAHVYLRLHKGQGFDDISEGVLEDCAQLVKANSIQGTKYLKPFSTCRELDIYITISRGVSVCCSHFSSFRRRALIGYILFSYPLVCVWDYVSGNKVNNVDVVYTPWSNLKKTASMDVGQVGFHNSKMVSFFISPEFFLLCIQETCLRMVAKE